MDRDVGWKEFLQDDARYADVINGLGCGGRQAVTVADLQEADTQTILGRVFERKDVGRRKSRRRKYRTKVRDMLRKVAFGVNFVIVGIENQELINYAAPLACMVYDAGEYEKQMGKVRKQIRKESRGLSAGEYLYGFTKLSRLFPVVTFLLYAGEEKWDGPTSLRGMLDFTDVPEELKVLVSDYVINVVELRALKDTSMFRTDVKQVFDIIRYSTDKEALKNLVESDSSYRSMEEDAYEVAAKYMNVKELFVKKERYKGKDGKVDMCKAMQELREEERAAGRAEGRTEGRAEGQAEELRNIVINMLVLKVQEEEIIKFTGCTMELLAQLRSELNRVS